MSRIRVVTKNAAIPAITMMLLVVGCHPNDDQPASEASVEFSFVEPGLASMSSRVFKSLDDADGIVVRIQAEGGEQVLPSSTIQLYRFGESYLSQRIPLSPGTYLLREFMVIDADGAALYATPMEGSPMAPLVSEPLAIEFDVFPDLVTTVRPELLGTEGAAPADFGYESFGPTGSVTGTRAGNPRTPRLQPRPSPPPTPRVGTRQFGAERVEAGGAEGDEAARVPKLAQ